MPLRLAALAWLALQLGQHHIPLRALLPVCAVAALPTVIAAVPPPRKEPK